jgi:hypothetical protein
MLKGPDGKFMHLPALPAAQSDIVILGRVVAAQSYVSPDGMGSYTEYTQHVERVLMNKPGRPIAVGDLVTLQRESGLLQYPDGHIEFDREWLGVGVPKRAGRYVLFIKLGSTPDVYPIVTGYRLQAGKVVEPLDEHFTDYNGLGEVLFLDRVTAAIGAGH